MKNNHQRKMSFLNQALEAGRKAFEYEKMGQLNKANVVFTKAANSINWAIALEFNQQKRNLLLKVYERFSITLHAPTPYNISPPPGVSYPSTSSNLNKMKMSSNHGFGGGGGNSPFRSKQMDNSSGNVYDRMSSNDFPPPPPPPSVNNNNVNNNNNPLDPSSLDIFGLSPDDDISSNPFSRSSSHLSDDADEKDEDEDDDLEDDEADDDSYNNNYNNNKKKRRNKQEKNSKMLDIQRLIMGKPDTRFKDVIGLESAIQALRDAVILPNQYPEWFKGNRQPWRAILLFGPPGTGKTMLARALAGESGCTFLCVTAADLLSKWFGQSEKAIRELFRVAKERAPSVLFIDEIDSFMGERSDGDSTVVSRRITNEFLTQMQGLKDDSRGVMVLGTTNIPWKLDRAIRRRFQKRIFIPLPDQPSRTKILENNIRETPHDLTPQDFLECARMTDGYSCSDIVGVAQSALMAPIHRIQKATYFRKVVMNNNNNNNNSGRVIWEVCSESDEGAVKKRFHEIQMENMRTPMVTRDDMIGSIQGFNPSIQKEELVRYNEFRQQFGN